jgi:hypothetical protein
MSNITRDRLSVPVLKERAEKFAGIAFGTTIELLPLAQEGLN